MNIIIPLYIFLYAYYFLIFIFIAFFLLNIRHLFQTGSVNLLSFFITFLILAFAVLVIFFTLSYLQGTDWNIGIKIFDKNWINLNNVVF